MKVSEPITWCLQILRPVPANGRHECGEPCLPELSTRSSWSRALYGGHEHSTWDHWELVRSNLSLFPCENSSRCLSKPRVTFGGSYPGSLSAWMRLRFPHLVSGSVSSSGPLWAKLDFFEYLQVKSDSSSINFVSTAGALVVITV